jgi:hypothetical protein
MGVSTTLGVAVPKFQQVYANATEGCLALAVADMDQNGVADVVCASRTALAWGTLLITTVPVWFAWNPIAAGPECFTSVAVVDLVRVVRVLCGART